MASTTIKLAKDTVERLKERGEFGQSFDEVVNRVLDESEDPDDGEEEVDN